MCSEAQSAHFRGHRIVGIFTLPFRKEWISKVFRSQRKWSERIQALQIPSGGEFVILLSSKATKHCSRSKVSSAHNRVKHKLGTCQFLKFSVVSMKCLLKRYHYPNFINISSFAACALQRRSLSSLLRLRSRIDEDCECESGWSRILDEKCEVR